MTLNVGDLDSGRPYGCEAFGIDHAAGAQEHVGLGDQARAFVAAEQHAEAMAQHLDDQRWADWPNAVAARRSRRRDCRADTRAPFGADRGCWRYPEVASSALGEEAQRMRARLAPFRRIRGLTARLATMPQAPSSVHHDEEATLK